MKLDKLVDICKIECAPFYMLKSGTKFSTVTKWPNEGEKYLKINDELYEILWSGECGTPSAREFKLLVKIL